MGRLEMSKLRDRRGQRPITFATLTSAAGVEPHIPMSRKKAPIQGLLGSRQQSSRADCLWGLSA